MNRTFLVFLLAIGLFACSTRTNTEPFTTAVLPTQEFLIANNRDTVLKTVHGTKISIKANSFATEGKVNIVIKEALTAFEIFAAGLTTESNGRPLRSGGMIFIDARANGKQPRIIQPINISIPNSSWDSEMQLFKGEEAADGSINWVNPDSLNETAQSRKLMAGKALFESKCKTCHAIFGNSTGPAMMGVDERIPDRAKIHQWITNYVAAIKSGDPLFVNISRISPTTMDLFPSLTRYDTDAIIDYVNNEVKLNKNNIPLQSDQNITNIKDTSTLLDAGDLVNLNYYNCDKFDTLYFAPQLNEQSILAVDDFVPAFNEFSNTNDTTPPNNVKKPKLGSTQDRYSSFEDVLSTESNEYQFSISTFGWYNIDAFMEGFEGTKNVKIWADVKNYEGENVNVYLFCPDKQILSVANERKNNKYFFNKIDGGVPLFLNDRAIIFAFTHFNDNFYYGISEFKISANQTIAIEMKKSSYEEIKETLIARQMNGIDLGIEKMEMKIVSKTCDSIPTIAKDTAK